ncbi:MAG TPA: phosphoenolpyruvate--protein phosphotransferase [Myxococcaceae bacterium]|nr:phosphoenolpyruvate--protein phosphotransferase [Myxococcaceae bacterium]
MSADGPRLSFHGIGASPGVAVGRAFVIDWKRLRTPRYRLAPKDVEGELMRVKTALELSNLQLEDIKAQLEQGDASDHAMILEAHRLMLHDPMLVDEVRRIIGTERINAEWAVRRVARKLRHLFDNIEDPYFRERKSDVEFVADRIVRNLMGQVPDEDLQIPSDAVVVARDLSPASAALLLKHTRVAGIVTDVGGQTSHTAIVARARATPAVVGAHRASEHIHTGQTVALDGTRGRILVNPHPDELALLRQAIREQEAFDAEARKLRDLPAVSTDGHRVTLVANLEFAEELPDVLAHGAEGIGLYRTEFLFLDRDTVPSEEEQLRAYRQVLEAMDGRPVTIRTLDLGGDKVRGLKRHEKEPNPALGLRGLRFCLSQPELFRTQLRAILRASAYGNVRLMFPMVATVGELREARAHLEACRTELGREGVPVGARFPVGIMLETPAGVWIADRLASEADFFSIGTNDLIQYSMAIDRQNREVAYLYRPLHLGVLRMIEHVVRSGKEAGIPVSLCGEMAGDVASALVLFGLGLNSMSMTSTRIPAVKRILRHASRAEVEALVAEAMQLSTAEEVERHVRAWLDRRFSELV